MTDYQQKDLKSGEPAPSEADGKVKASREDNEVIELSDIAIGTTQEDEAVIELTEELIEEAMNGISGVTVEASDDHQMLDLTQDDTSAPFQMEKPDAGEESGRDESDAGDEESLFRELDDYFGTDEEDKKEPEAAEEINPEKGASETETAAVPGQDLGEAVETAIRRMYSDQINQIVEEMVEKAVAAELDRLRETIIAALKK